MITTEFQYELKNKDLKDPLSKMERKIVGIAKNTLKYEPPFTAKNLERLYKGATKGRCCFCIFVNRKGRI